VPFGTFTDVMLQCADDERVLLAPDDSVAGFVASTYRFDRVEVGAVSSGFGAGQLVAVFCGWCRGDWRPRRAGYG
jgi:hypothetical protein